MSRKSQHIVPTKDGGWAVRTSGAGRAAKVFLNQKDALRYGRGRAKRDGVDLFVHRKDGTIEQADAYGRQGAAAKG